MANGTKSTLTHGECTRKAVSDVDRYDFATVVDEIFKESESIEAMVARYVQMKKDLDSIFRQNIALKGE